QHSVAMVLGKVFVGTFFSQKRSLVMSGGNCAASYEIHGTVHLIRVKITVRSEGRTQSMKIQSFIVGTFLAGVFLLAPLAAQTQAQQQRPLGDIARELRKYKQPSSSRFVYTNDNLPHDATISVVTPAATPEKAAAEGKVEAVASPEDLKK